MQLRKRGEDSSIAGRCADYYVARCRRSPIDSSGLARWFAWIDVELDNVRWVLRRCLLQDEIARGLELAVSLGWYWITRATAEGARWLDELLAAEEGRLGAGQRQAEVGRLVAEGLTNRQIGARLFISEYTVDSHVRVILNKLGFTSLSQIAAWVSERDRRPEVEIKVDRALQLPRDSPGDRVRPLHQSGLTTVTEFVR